jgi:outer membrane protein
MSAGKLSMIVGVLTLASGPLFAQPFDGLGAVASGIEGQARPPASAPKPQTPPAGQPPAAPPKAAPAQPAAPKPQPSMPFPPDAKYAVVDMQAIASTSVSGKAATAKLQTLTEAKQKEIGDKTKQLQALTTKRDTSLGVMNDAARQQLDKDIERLQREIQFAQSNAQAEVQDLNNELMSDFQQKVAPIIEAIAKEKGLYLVFTAADSGFAYVYPGLNITDEVIKRLDAKK